MNLTAEQTETVRILGVPMLRDSIPTPQMVITTVAGCVLLLIASVLTR